jgi:hypothetical protein
MSESTMLDEIKSFSFMDTPADSIGVLWAYMIIYVIINLGAWSMVLWPIYRPLSVAQVSFFAQKDRINGNSKNGRGNNTSSLLAMHRRGSASRGTQRAAPQYLWD